MNKVAFLVVLTGTLVSLAAVAQIDAAAERNRLMSAMWREGLSPLNRLARGQEPYSQDTVARSFARLSEIAAQLPPLWPTGSLVANPTSRYTSSPRVWENKGDFEARLARLATVIAANREKALSGPEGARAAFETVNNFCNACHEVYQVRVR